MNALNYHWLYYFWMTAKEGSMTAAAQKLGVTQPTVSALVQELEEWLGQDLFDRSGRSLQVSESGAIALKYAEEIFGLGREMCSTLLGSAPLSRHPFRIGVADVVPKILAQRIIDPVYSLDPPVSIHCLNDSAQHLLASLALHELDLVIADAPISPAIKVKAFHHPVLECKITLVARKDIARSLRKNFPDSLVDSSLLLPAAGSLFRQNIDFWLQAKGLMPIVRAEFEDTGIMKIAGAHGHGAFPVPELIEREVCKDYHVEPVGHLDGLSYALYLISLERKIKHPVVTSIVRSIATTEK